MSSVRQRPSSTPPLSKHHLNGWTTPPAYPTPTASHRHSAFSNALTTPHRIYHPLQQQHVTSNTRMHPSPMRRVTSPDLRMHKQQIRSSTPQPSMEQMVSQTGHPTQSSHPKRPLRRGSWTGPQEMPAQDGRSQSAQLYPEIGRGRGGGEWKRGAGKGRSLHRKSLDAGLEEVMFSGQIYHPGSQSSQVGGHASQTGFLTDQTSSQVSWDGYSPTALGNQDTGFREPSSQMELHYQYNSPSQFPSSYPPSSHSPSSYPPSSHHPYTQSQEKFRVPILNRGEAWNLEDDEEGKIVRTSHSSHHVDEALFASKLPRHYFHSSQPHHSHPHSHSHSPSHPQPVRIPSSTKKHRDQTQSFQKFWPNAAKEKPSTPVMGAENVAPWSQGSPETTPPISTGSAGSSSSRKIVSNLEQQQKVTKWLRETEARDDTPLSADRAQLSNKMPSQQRGAKGTQAEEQPPRPYTPTRTFSYIQAQVHPVNAQNLPPSHGFHPQHMAAAHQHSNSSISDNEPPSLSSRHDPTSASYKHPKSSPYPHRSRSKSSPSPSVVRRYKKKEHVKRQQLDDPQQSTKRTNMDATHPEKRFSTGNVCEEEDAPVSIARRGSSPGAVGVTNKGHPPTFPYLEDQADSSDDTGGQSDSEGIFRKKTRNKSSGNLMSKIARKLGRNSAKPNQYTVEVAPPVDEREESPVFPAPGGRTLQVPIPKTQKKMKSMSTSHLDSGCNETHHRQHSLQDRYSPDFEPRTQDEHWYQHQGTPPPATPPTPLPGTPKMLRSSSRSRQQSTEPELDGILTSASPVTPVTMFRSGSKRNLSADVNEVLFELVEQGNVEGVEQMLETNTVQELNITNEDDFTAVDVAVMLDHQCIARMLLDKGARDSTRFCREPFTRFSRVVALLADAERELDSVRYELVVQTSSGVSGSTLRDLERKMRRCEWRAHLFKRMKANYESADVPGAPTNVSLHVTSNRSLTVRFTEPISTNGAIITRYKIEWCHGSDQFSPIVGEFVLTDLRSNEYVIPDLNKGECYFVRVSAFNMKGFGQPRLSLPACAIPSSWHDRLETNPRFEGSTDNIHIISAQLTMSLTNSPPISPPILGSTPVFYRKTTMKKGISKLFGTNIRFQKSLRPGVYVSSLVYTDDSKVVVTVDEQLPIIEISDSPPSSSIGGDFVWLAKVACTWDHVRGMSEVSDSFTSSPAIHFKNKILHAIQELQTALGLQDLGLLHPVPYRDSHGAVVFVIAHYVKDSRSIQSSSLKWVSLPRLWKKRPQASCTDIQAIPVPDQLIVDAQEIIAHHGNSTRPLSRGLYLGYLKARSTVASMKVICSREYPNVLPHHKIRDNPNISREEWEWLKSLPTTSSSSTSSSSSSTSPDLSSSPPPSQPCSVTGPHSLQRLLPSAVDTFLHNLGIFKEDAEKHQLYCHEVIELNENISFLLIMPPSEQVCTPPGSTDHFAKLSGFVALPINTFEIMQLYTYQKSFMTKFSMVSARLDLELLTAQQRMREAFSKAEVMAAKQLKEELDAFQERTEQAWKQMRWIEEAVQTGRSQSAGVETLLPVKTFREAVRVVHGNGLRRGTLTESIHRDPPSSGYLRVYPAYTTGLVKGTSVKLFITLTTTTSEVVSLVVQQLEKARLQKDIPGPLLTEDDISDFYLVARHNGRESTLDPNYTPLQLQTHGFKWRLLVRRYSEEQRASEQTTSV